MTGKVKHAILACRLMVHESLPRLANECVQDIGMRGRGR